MALFNNMWRLDVNSKIHENPSTPSKVNREQCILHKMLLLVPIPKELTQLTPSRRLLHGIALN
jgi:hypothetical protein